MRSNDKYVSTSEGGVVVLEVSESDAGRYECWLAGSMLCVYHVPVETHRCSPPGKSVDYHKVYSDWCHEFQKYKNAMKSWERKKEVRKLVSIWLCPYELMVLHFV